MGNWTLIIEANVFKLCYNIVNKRMFKLDLIHPWYINTPPTAGVSFFSIVASLFFYVPFCNRQLFFRTVKINLNTHKVYSDVLLYSNV
jgi:hypothetical protein